MADLVMRKRRAMHAGEIGLFIDSQVFEEDFEHIKTGTDIAVKATQSRNLRQMRLGWAIAAKISLSGAFGDADRREVMDWILMRCRHVRYVTNRHRDGMETTPVVKSIRFEAMEGTEFNRLFNRMIYIVISEILPNMPESELRAEIEKMAGIEAPEPEPKKRRRRRTISVIPADEPVTSGYAPSQPEPPAPEEPLPEAQAPHSVPAASSPPPADPAPSPVAGVAAQGHPLTRDFAGWRDYCLAWLEEYRTDPEKTDQDLMARWNGERSLRNECGITSDERQPVAEVYLGIVDEKRKKGKPL